MKAGSWMRRKKTIDAHADIAEHCATINLALQFIAELLQRVKENDRRELMLLRLAVRYFNRASASFRILRCGYYHQSFALTRDVLECAFLLDLFSTNPDEIDRWCDLPAKEREKHFRPVIVRDRLDKRDGFEGKRRGQFYKLLSNYAAHPTPEGFAVSSPDGDTPVGPFPNEKLLRAGVEELAHPSATRRRATLTPAMRLATG